MQIKADYLTKTLVNLTQTEGDKLNLVQGEILKGMVESLKENGMIMVNLKGRSIEAFTELVLTPGQELYLMVDEPQDSKTVLRLATPQMMAERTNEKIAVNLNQMGIKTDDTTLALAQKLMQHDLPVTKSNIEAMVRITRDLGGMTPSNLELASTALAGGIKTDQATISSLREFVTRPVVVKQVIQQAIKALENYVDQAPAKPAPPTTDSLPPVTASKNQQPAAALKNGGPITPSPANTDIPDAPISGPPTPKTELQPMQPKMVLTSNPAEPETAAVPSKADMPVAPIQTETKTIQNQDQTGASQEKPNLQDVERQPQLPPRLGPVPGDKIADNLLQNPRVIAESDEAIRAGDQQIKPSTGFISPPSTNPISGFSIVSEEPPSVKTMETLRLILPMLGLTGDDPEQLITELKQHFEGNKEVIKALNVAEQLLQKDPAEVKHPAIQHAMNQIRDAEKQIVGQAAFNSLDPSAPDSNLPGYYYYAIPVEVNGRNHTVELKLYKDGKARRPLDEMNEVRVAVALDTKNLGQVVFHVTWNRDNGLTLQGAVQSLRYKNVIENGVPELTAKLRELGFPVNYLGVKVAYEPEKLRPALEEVKEQSRILGIDIKV